MDETNQSPKEIPPTPLPKKDIPKLHTYAGDFGQSIQGERGDIIRRAIKEEEQKEALKEANSKASKENMLMLAGTVLAFVIGIGAIAYFAISNRPKTIEPVDNRIQSIVFADTSKEIPLTGLSKEQFIAKARTELAADMPDGSVRYVFLTDTRDGMKYLAGAKTFLTLLASNAPELLTDGLGTTFMLGAYATNGENEPFLIFTTNSYNDAFAGMRVWENRLFDDLYQIFAISTFGDNSQLFAATFEDTLIKNKAARVLRNSTAAVELLYAFPDDRTILITTSPATLEEITLRLTAQKVEQR